MSFLPGLFKGVAAATLSVLALVAFGSVAAPTASFVVSPPGNPVVNQTVQFTDTSSGVPTSWLWNFGDGQSSTQESPTHQYLAPGNYTVSLTATNATGSTVAQQPLIVSPEDVLRLNAPHPFSVTLAARDQRTGNTGEGVAIPQNDLFGYFSIPDLTQNRDNPEVFVKVLDGRPINGQFWVFYGGLTDLEYTLTVTELPTGRAKIFFKAGGSACGEFDTSGFNFTPTPAATPAATLTPTPTRTPTPPAVTVVDLVATRFVWTFTSGGTNFGSSFRMQAGQPYQLRVRGGDPGDGSAHGFSGFPGLGVSGFSLNASNRVVNITPTSSQVGMHLFVCTQPSCGSGHGDMLGSVQVTP